MRKLMFVVTVMICISIAGCTSCNNKKPTTPQPTALGGYPDKVGAILVNKCATAGCHNEASYMNSAGLRLDKWEHLFEGGGSGASVVPYSPDFSPLLYFVNTDPARGTVATPTMPFDPMGGTANALTTEEYNTLKEWITNGAPNDKGEIAFADDAENRQKFLLTQQGCDLVAVIDAKSNLVMRYIRIGVENGIIESPHCLRTSGDGKYAYISYLNGTATQRIDTKNDLVANTLMLGSGSWNIIYVSPGDSMIITTDWRSNGRVLYAGTEPMSLRPELTGSGAGAFIFPHGITTTRTGDTSLITAQYGNVIYKYAPKVPYYKRISLNGKDPIATNSGDKTSPNPHEILMTPDYSKCFVTCEGTNEVRVLDPYTDKVLDSIPVGTFPQEMAISRTKPFLFVTCMEDGANPNPGRRGSVYVINYNTHQIVGKIYGDFYQPHAIAVDDLNGKVLIASTNANPGGPAPHHATACGGRAGWYSIYSLSSLEPVNTRRYQVTVMPYSADVRFKN